MKGRESVRSYDHEGGGSRRSREIGRKLGVVRGSE